MKGLKSPRHVQRFLSTHDQIANVFSCPHPGVHALGRGDRHCNTRMITPISGIASFLASNRNKLTVPPASPSDVDLPRAANMVDEMPPPIRPQSFRETTSCSIALSSDFIELINHCFY